MITYTILAVPYYSYSGPQSPILIVKAPIASKEADDPEPMEQDPPTVELPGIGTVRN